MILLAAIVIFNVILIGWMLVNLVHAGVNSDDHYHWIMSGVLGVMLVGFMGFAGRVLQWMLF
jgi:hypothetical protein